MTRPYSPVLLALMLAACTPRTFYTNAPLDAMATTRALDVKRIEAENTVFIVYKLSDGQYAIIPRLAAGTVTLNAINNALILSPKQREEFLAAAAKIVTAHDRSTEGSISIVEYHLTLNESVFVGSSATVVAAGVARTNSRVVESQRVVFRLQFVDTGASRMAKGKTISYLFEGFAGKMKLQDLRALIGDLKK